MRSVSLRQARRDARLRRVSFQLQQGQLVLVRRPTGATKQLLAGAVLGLVRPKRGEVLVEGKCWSRTSYHDRLQMRSRIGRVFDSGGWLISMSVMDNIMLQERHHRLEDDETLRQRVISMLSDFEMSPPTDRPAYVEDWKLRICQCVRALLGNPKLLVLERPFNGVSKQHRETLFRIEQKYRDRGGATLWITDCPLVWSTKKLKDAKRFEIVGENLVPRQWEASL